MIIDNIGGNISGNSDSTKELAMPQTTPERAARWPGIDQQAIKYLEGQGYELNRDWTWKKPSPKHVITDREEDAILYLIQEWDFGGTEKEANG